MTGIAPGARLWAVRVLDSGGSGDLSEYIAGVDWITAHAEVIEVANSSLRYLVTSSPAFTEAMNASIAAGVVHVAAAGNENEAVRYVPGNHPNVITVSAIADYDGRAGGEGFWTCESYGLDDRKASFSDYGSTVDITAPGVCIYSTLPGNQYGYESGTSMAAPHVSGAAALLAVRSNPNSQSDVTAIRNTLVNEGNLGWTDTSGDGIQEPLLDVGDPAVFLLLGAPVVTTSPASGVTSTGATLNGVVNPSGFSTSYHFEYGLTTAYGMNAPVPDGSIGSTLYAAHSVSQSISGLQPKRRITIVWWHPTRGGERTETT